LAFANRAALAAPNGCGARGWHHKFVTGKGAEIRRKRISSGLTLFLRPPIIRNIRQRIFDQG
jgi:hypothetical protein